MSNQIQVGDVLDMQKGRMVYVGDGKADAQQYQQGKGYVTIKTAVVLTPAQVDAWHALKIEQASYSPTRTSATL